MSTQETIQLKLHFKSENIEHLPSLKSWLQPQEGVVSLTQDQDPNHKELSGLEFLTLLLNSAALVTFIKSYFDYLSQKKEELVLVIHVNGKKIEIKSTNGSTEEIVKLIQAAIGAEV